MTGEIKEILADTLIAEVEKFQAARAKVDDEVLAPYMKVRPLEFE